MKKPSSENQNGLEIVDRDTPAMHETKPQGTTFLDLPAELRHRIYAMVTIEEGPIRIPYLSRPKWSLELEYRPLEPPLLAANRQIRSEASTVFYGYNIFRTSGTLATKRMLEQLPQFQIAQIRRLEIRSASGLYSRVLANALRMLAREFSGKGLSRNAVFVQSPAGNEGYWVKLCDVEVSRVVEKYDGWTVEWAGTD